MTGPYKLLDFQMSASVPPQAAAQLIQDKGKARDVVLQMKQIQGTGWVLEVLESKDDRRPKFSYPVRRVISELKCPDNDPWTVILVTTQTDVTFAFKNTADATTYHTFISDKSEVHAENRAISQLDEDMRNLWPFPGGSFF
jgi:hypothetical protein